MPERSPGCVWRWKDEIAIIDDIGGYQTVVADPCPVISLSGLAPARREGAELFVPWEGPNYAIWPWSRDQIPTVEANDFAFAANLA